MKFFVNRKECIGCGICEEICFPVFTLGDDGISVAIDEDVPEEILEAAAEAKKGCPVGAIEER